MIAQKTLQNQFDNNMPGISSWEDCLYDLFSPDSNIEGEAFFAESIQMLNRFISADYTFVGVIDENDDTVDEIAFCDKYQALPTYSYPLESSPCADVIKNTCVLINDYAQITFPYHTRFTELGIKSYFGVPLYNSKKKIVGVLGALYTSAQPNSKRLESLMYMFSSRIASELEHVERERELKRRNLELLVFEEELLRKNQELDGINQELKRISFKAEESNKLKSSFLANLSHEIRTPMNAIIGFTELLRSDNISDEEKTDYLNIVYQNGNRLMRVMDALIDISKLQARSTIISKGEISVNDLLLRFKRKYQEELDSTNKPINIQVYLGMDEGNDTLITYGEAFEKTLEHLMDNAIKFTQKGTIKIGYTLNENTFDFYVEDTGIGIESGQEQNIFDMFRQADLNTTREFEGTGLGLAIVSKYLEMMGGDVWAEPNRKEGAMLRFRIPILKKQP